MARLLVYSPNHGLGVEAHLLTIVARLAVASHRIVVLPRLPEFETTNYREGIERYFRIPSGFPCLAMDELAGENNRIDVLYCILPYYRHEYVNPIYAELHPVWYENIHSFPYFESVGFTIGSVQTLKPRQSMRLDVLLRLLNRDDPIVALSYVNGLIREYEVADDTDELAHSWMPCEPQPEFYVRQPFRNIQLAVHVRRGNLALVREKTGQSKLPELELFLDSRRAGDKVFIASDDAATRQLLADRIGRADCRWNAEEGIYGAVLDVAVCSDADLFVGSLASTFSVLIRSARRRRGHPDSSSVLLS
jgi:hypothetical protein